MNTLARISRQLNDEENAKYWDAEAKAMLDRLIEHSWNGERFVAKVSITHEHEENPTSLLSLMPLVLGEMLPKDISDKLVAVLEKDFLTENGLATEMPASKHYNPDGYWRGPIWAPSTYLIVDGLRRGGYTELAETVAKRYCDMSCLKAKGNYENFDALTGKGWRAPGYTWSASVYMLLRGEYDK
jgi:glycogen debranching enzyme